MKTCNGCKYAKWDRTKTGRLSPTGDGVCTVVVAPKPLPNAFYYISGPDPICGGSINRRSKEYRNHCPYYQDDGR